jgi:dolichol-phosphate mannosyltransferase
LVIPAYNEAGIVEDAVLGALRVLDARQLASYEVVLVDDGSSDPTLSVLRTIERRQPAVRVLAHERNRGLGAALRTGFEHCRGEVLTWIPGDGQFDLREVLEGLPLMQQYDIVVALRDTVTQSSRIVITWCFHLLTWTLFRFNATDMCGIYLIRRSVLEEIRPQAQNIFYNLEIPILCVKHGKRMAKIQLRLRPRLGGASKVSNARTLRRNLIEMARIWFSWRREGAPPSGQYGSRKERPRPRGLD